MATTEIVYLGHDNPAVVTVTSTDSDTPLSGVTRITCEFVVAGVTVDSDSEPGVITWTDTAITFDLGDQAVTDLQQAIVVVYDTGHPDGQVIAHPEGPVNAQLSFKFI